MGRKEKDSDIFFGLLESHEVRMPNFALMALHLVFGMQWIAFTINEATAWDKPVAEIQCPFVMTHLPFWDEGGRCFGYSQTFFEIVHWAVVGLISSAVLMSVLLYINPRRFISATVGTSLTQVNRILLLLLTEFLFVPCIRLLLEAKPDRLGWLSFLLGCVALVFLFASTCCTRFIFSDVLPCNVSNLNARAHGRVHVLLTILQTTLAGVLAFAPALVSQITVAVLSLMAAAVFWHCQPFYRHAVNAYYVAIFAVATYTGFLSVFATVVGASTGVAWALATGGALVLPLGFYVATWRFFPMYPVSEGSLPDMAFHPFDNVVQPFKPDEDMQVRHP